MLDYLYIYFLVKCMNGEEIISMQRIGEYYQSPIVFWLMGEILCILAIALALEYFPKSSLALLFDALYEKMHDFFQDILWKEIQTWVLKYVLTLFSVILFSNLMSAVLSVLSPFFGMNTEWEFYLEHYITVPSADIHFNLAMAIMSMCVIIYVQLKAYGFWGFLYEYFPIFGKNYIVIEQGNMNHIVFKIISIVAKIFDIIVSLFLGFLDLLEYAARTISLSFRLFGNMTSGGVLIWMVFIGIGSLTTNLWNTLGDISGAVFWFIGLPQVGSYITALLWHNFPIIIPVFLYLEEFLVAFIQAMVFSLLVTIFIKVALAEAEMEQTSHA